MFENQEQKEKKDGFANIEDELFNLTDKATVLPTLKNAAMHEIKNPIDANTLAKLIQTDSHPYILIDCRFDYEFNAGHIKGAKNIMTPKELVEELLSDPSRVRHLMTSQTAIILHCEYSERRAPQAW